MSNLSYVTPTSKIDNISLLHNILMMWFSIKISAEKQTHFGNPMTQYVSIIFLNHNNLGMKVLKLIFHVFESSLFLNIK